MYSLQPYFRAEIRASRLGYLLIALLAQTHPKTDVLIMFWYFAFVVLVILLGIVIAILIAALIVIVIAVFIAIIIAICIAILYCIFSSYPH